MNRKINLEEDFVAFLKLCNQYQVRYLVVGGYAVSIHGYPRSTKDMDLCIEMSNDNAMKMVRVVNDFGFESLKLTAEDFLRKDFITQLGYPPLRIDILNDIEGVNFDRAWGNKKVVMYEGIEIPFVGFNELLIMKERAGRPQDLADIKKLQKRNKPNK